MSLIRAPSMGLTYSPRMLVALQELNLTSGLQICLDSSDFRSYASGTDWDDISGNGNDFASGGGATAPTFNGVAGELANYWSTDAGDYFRIGANPAVVNQMHQNSAVFTIAAWVYWSDVSSANNIICGTNGASGTTHGIYWGLVTTDNLSFVKTNGSAAQVVFNIANTVPLNTWSFVTLATTEATPLHTIGQNGSYTTNATAYTSPSASAATYAMELFMFGNAVNGSTNGSRMGAFAVWNTALTQAQTTAIYNRTRRRFGV
jgi:hypothetical protein